ncbi:MAG: metallophosphoesterase [Patescibacteria group bacterium]
MSARVATWLFDGVTAVLLAAIPLYFWSLRGRWAKIPLRGRYVLFAGALGFLWLAVFYGSFIEPKMLTVRTYEVSAGSGSDKISLAVVSDLHLGVYKGRAWTERVVRRINELKPDVILLAGDFAANQAGLEALEPFRDLRAKDGVYAVLGNIDYEIGGVDIRRRIESYGIEVLTNESVRLGDSEREVRLIGLDDLKYGHPDWEAALAEVPAGAFTILAAHNPNAVQRAETLGLDVVVSGHTHGGQIRLPFIGPLAPLPTRLGRRFDRGLFDYGPVSLLITPGAGETGTRARLLCPPEISVLEISY